MTSHFLKAKHWQLFTLIIGLPFIFQSILLSVITDGLAGGTGLSLDTFFLLLPIAPIWVLSFSLAWLYSVGAGLQSRVPIVLRRPTRFFKVALVFPVAYILLIIAAMFPMFSVMDTYMIGSNFVLVTIMGLHLSAMFCVMYSWYFSAKTINLAELKQPVSFGDVIGDFSLFWFLPVGIWILQTRINELYKTEATSTVEEDYV